MKGNEHYVEAERLIADSAAAMSHADRAAYFAEAQVHATLALAAAMVWGSVEKIGGAGCSKVGMTGYGADSDRPVEVPK